MIRDDREHPRRKPDEQDAERDLDLEKETLKDLSAKQTDEALVKGGRTTAAGSINCY